MSIDRSTAPLASSSPSESPAPRPRIGFVSLGCPKNLVDSEVMMGMLSTNGAEITSRAEDADIIVVNTCSFIDTAKQESVDTILEMVAHKTHGRARKLIVTGCLVERYRDEIQKNIPEIDAVLGTGELADILEAAGIAPIEPESTPFTILNAATNIPHCQKQANMGHPRIPAPRSSLKVDSTSPPTRVPKAMPAKRPDALPATAGTAHAPSCPAISTTRTRRACWPRRATPPTSRSPKAATIPAPSASFRSCAASSAPAPSPRWSPKPQRLAAQGVREINLIGQDTTCFGEDLGLQDGLAALLEQLAQIESLRWVRFLYAYPNKITPRLLEVLASNPRLCRYIDVPLQHASTEVLKRMKRGGSAEIFLKLIAKMRQEIPDLTLRTSFIVGFPGETEDDFQQLCDFVTAAQFDWLGVFAYSDEEGSPAFLLDGKVPPKEIERRRRQLMQLQKRISRQRRKQWIGREIEVMLEGPSEETDLLWEARTPAHAPEIDGKVFINDFGEHTAPQPGSFHRAIVEEAHDYDLVARLL